MLRLAADENFNNDIVLMNRYGEQLNGIWKVFRPAPTRKGQ